MKILMETRRDGYSTSQCGRTLTVGELIELLQGYDEETPIYFSNDNRYTYGSLNYDLITKDYESEDE